ncbi:MAG: hypothetical protein ACR2HQ_00185 [Ilumatobacteraceae bacterium]
MMRRRSALLLLPLLAGLVACGGGDDSGSGSATTAAATTEAPARDTAAGTTLADTASETVDAGGEEFCATAEELANYNAEAPQLDVTADWETIKGELLASAESALPLYHDAIASAPDEAQGNLETLQAYTDEILVGLEESESVDEFISAFSAPSQEILTATAELDEYLQENCGFGLTHSS